MRDPRVVKMVLDASLTGHRVISTYHAGDIPSVFARLLHQGFEPFLVAAAVTGVISQRLVPGIDGDLVPIVAAMQPDHKWRDFLCHHPDLATLQEKIHSDPLANLNTQVDLVQEEGKISKEQAALLKI